MQIIARLLELHSSVPVACRISRNEYSQAAVIYKVYKTNTGTSVTVSVFVMNL